MENIIQKRPFVISKDKCNNLVRVPVSQNEFQEEWMQRLLQNSPELLPVAEIEPIFSPLVCIGREVRTSAGLIDNLYISPKGYITIVETKLWRNPESRRAVVGQILDYTKELKCFSYEDLDQRVRQYSKNYLNKECGLFEFMVNRGLLTQEDETIFVDQVEKNLSNARFLLLVVGDGIREGVWRMAEFLNETPNMRYTLALVQLEVYQMPNEEKLVVPNLLMQTKYIERGVFRFEKGELLQVTEDSIGEKDVAIKKLTIEEFIKSLKTTFPNLNESDFNNFLIDLEDLGYVISTSGKKDLVVKYPVPGSKQTLNVIYFSTDRKKEAYKIKGTFEKDLENRGYSAEIAKDFYNSLEPYEILSSIDSNTINHDIIKMLADSKNVVIIFEKLTTYF